MFAALNKLFPSIGTRSNRAVTPIVRRARGAGGGGYQWPDEDRSKTGLADRVRSINADGARMAATAELYAINSPNGSAILRTLEGHLAGTGIKPQSMHPVEAVRQRLHRNWYAWTDIADADSRFDLYGLMASAVRDLVTFGEFLAVHLLDPATGAPQMRRLHPNQLDRNKNTNLGGGALIIQGVEFNSAGRIAAYWLLPPSDTLGAMAPISHRYPATDVIHMFRPLVPGQVRGLSWFASVMRSAESLNGYVEGMLHRIHVSSLFIGSVTDTDLPGTENADGSITAPVSPGAIRIESPGKKMEWNDPPSADGAAAFSADVYRMIAAGAGITYEALTGNYGNVNYSSARAALLEFRRFCEGVQHNVIVFQLCRPMWRRFILWQVLKGEIPASAYQADRAAFEAVKWIPPGWDWVDPEAEVKAAVLAMENNLRSRSEIIASRGYDIEQLDAEIAADQQRLKRLGIETPAKQPQTEPPANAA